LPEEINGAEQWDDQFTQGSAKNVDRFAEPAEEEMTAFVDDQIDVVEDEESGAVSESINEEERVKAKPSDAGTARNRFPFAELFFEESHWRKRSKTGCRTATVVSYQ
jgi:hypothetical protein